MRRDREKKAPIVAELGRAETAEEKIARKQEESRLYRSRKTVNNLVFSLLVCLAIMFAFVLFVPRGTGDYLTRNVNVAELAQQSRAGAGQQLAAPVVPSTWLAKQAEIRYEKSSLSTYWYIGYNTENEEYLSVSQGFNQNSLPASQQWLVNRVESKKPTGQLELAGLKWTVYDHHTDSPDNSNVLYALVTELEQSTLVIGGTGTAEQIQHLAELTVQSLVADGNTR